MGPQPYLAPPPIGYDAPQPGGQLLPAQPVLPEALPATTPPDAAFNGGQNGSVGTSDDAYGFGDFGGHGGGEFGSVRPIASVRYSAIWFPSVPVHGQPSDFEEVGQDFSFTHPLWSDPVSLVSFSAGVNNRIIDTSAVLPGTGQPIPSDLWNIHFGLRYARELDNGWTAGGGVSFGSASDQPFASIREMNLGMNAMLRVPEGEHNAWLFTLTYSPTSELAFPVPGVAFSYNPSPEFHANIGLPFQMVWRPNEDWQFQGSYMLIHTIHLRARRRLTDRMSLFAAYDFSNEAYSLVDRPEENDRFFLYDQRVSMGLQTALFWRWTATASAGYVFDRYLFEGTSLASSASDRVDLGAGPFMMLNIGARF